MTIKDGKELYYCHNGCAQPDLLTAIRDCSYKPHFAVQQTVRPENSSVRDYARQLWRGSVIGAGTVVETYLAQRGIQHIPPSIRFLSRHRHTDSGNYYPVMLAAVTDTAGRVQAVHRTFLSHDGKLKAPVTPAKKSLAPIDGLACHLAPADKTLAVTEGIETGLSVMQAAGIPTWAALSAGGIERLILPPLPLAREIIICADHDVNGVGQQAAATAAQRWLVEGRCVRIAIPSTAGTDFNDILLEVT
jgi:putative DNA primase/helicase